MFHPGQGDLLVSISSPYSAKIADSPSITGGNTPLLVTTDPQSKGNTTFLLRITFIRKLYEAANLDTPDLYVLVTLSQRSL